MGTSGGPGGGRYTTPRITNRALWIVELDQTDANNHLIVQSGILGDLVVQLAFDQGKKDGASEVTVLPAH